MTLKPGVTELSIRTRSKALDAFDRESFDVLVIGGGITGVAVAREAQARGLRTALIERSDLAFGTSSRSSKLVHGGLRYLENFEFGLVFESLRERAYLLKQAPEWVKPMEFYFPVYRGDRVPGWKLGLGLWLYDFLTLFRTPGFHRRISREQMLERFSGISADGLQGGYRYFDATMWDDLLVPVVLRQAVGLGTQAATYCEATRAVWSEDRVTGVEWRDVLSGRTGVIRAKEVVSCVGPWTDGLGESFARSRSDKNWTPWLAPSQGTHLVFQWSRLPLPGVLVMSDPKDGRIIFAIPRRDFGEGVTIVGTTDGPLQGTPGAPEVKRSEIDYILSSLGRYLPGTKLEERDIVSAYVGIRPLFKPADGAKSLQKVSREHHIERGLGGVTFVAGGKYTTHRAMAEEILTHVTGTHSDSHSRSQTCKKFEMTPLLDFARKGDLLSETAGFGPLEAQLRRSIGTELCVKLDDFILRRLPIFLASKDHGEKWIDRLAEVLAEELRVIEPTLQWTPKQIAEEARSAIAVRARETKGS